MNVREVLENSPNRIRQIEETLFHKRALLEQATHTQLRLKNATMTTVGLEKDDKGKPKYTTKEIRESEVQNRLSDNKTWRESQELIQTIEYELARLRIELEFEINRFKAARSLARLFSHSTPQSEETRQ